MSGRSLNKVMLIGHLGSDPELRYTPSGVPVVSFSLATNESWNDKEGNRQEITEWHKIVAWRKLAEICGQYLTKGRQVYIEGKLQTRSWEDQNGVKKYTTEIIANEMMMLSSTGERSDSHYGPPPHDEPPGYIKDTRSDNSTTEEDIPF